MFNSDSHLFFLFSLLKRGTTPIFFAQYTNGSLTLAEFEPSSPSPVNSSGFLKPNNIFRWRFRSFISVIEIPSPSVKRSKKVINPISIKNKWITVFRVTSSSIAVPAFRSLWMKSATWTLNAVFYFFFAGRLLPYLVLRMSICRGFTAASHRGYYFGLFTLLTKVLFPQKMIFYAQ